MRVLRNPWILCCRGFCSQVLSETAKPKPLAIVVNNKTYERDDYTNLSPKILTYVGKNLHCKDFHPLSLVRQNIVNYFYSKFVGKTGNPIFSVYDNLNPVVSVKENFDSLLVPDNHVSRQKTDCYYVNKEYMLRAHTTAHQYEFIQMGLDNFLVFGDVYRRDEIDRTHYPVFHQADGVYTLNKNQIENVLNSEITLFADSPEDTDEKQRQYTLQATKFVEEHLKNTLLGLIKHLYKKDIESRWVTSVFPFTHPSWELEIKLNDEWIETLGCGIIKHNILKNAGAGDRIGWAFGLGLERLAMQKYGIPDIRYFWSQDTGFTSQFEGATVDTAVAFKEVSVQPQCILDLCFWLPEDETSFKSGDFYELCRNIGGDILEQVKLTSEFYHPKKQRTCHTYRIVYRHMSRPLLRSEANLLHTKISNWAVRTLHVEIRH